MNKIRLEHLLVSESKEVIRLLESYKRTLDRSTVTRGREKEKHLPLVGKSRKPSWAQTIKGLLPMRRGRTAEKTPPSGPRDTGPA